MTRMTSLQFNNTITERDMDLLLAESILSDNGFCRLIIGKTDLAGKTFQVLNAELSKSDNDLGESDITVILEVDGKKVGLLIEDKINAIAMPEQHERYVKRGEKGVKAGDYDEFRVFLICPKKYYAINAEAKCYEHHLTYEECQVYFAKKDDLLSSLRYQQLNQALHKGPVRGNGSVDERANAFLRQYIHYQKEHYPSLDLSTKEDKNGWWTDFRTNLGSVYINHKIREGYVDLTFPKASDRIDRAKSIAEWAMKHKMPNIQVIKTKTSAMMRIHVPKLDIEKGFESVDKDELDQCFDAVKELTDFANMIQTAQLIL